MRGVAEHKWSFCEAECRQDIFCGLIQCRVHNKPPYKNLYFISCVKKRIGRVIIFFFTMYNVYHKVLCWPLIVLGKNLSKTKILSWQDSTFPWCEPLSVAPNNSVQPWENCCWAKYFHGQSKWQIVSFSRCTTLKNLSYQVEISRNYLGWPRKMGTWWKDYFCFLFLLFSSLSFFYVLSNASELDLRHILKFCKGQGWGM